MRKVNEQELRKDSTVNKVQFDKEWFYSLEDMEDYLKEDLSGVEYIHLPMMIDEVKYTVKCATWEDIKRALQQEPLEDFRGSVLKNRKPPQEGGINKRKK
jgi:hypothetical protein